MRASVIALLLAGIPVSSGVGAARRTAHGW